MIPSPTNDTNTSYATGNGGTMYRRIRTPHEHDVLSGRGGGINAHAGNVVFREWVRVRKNEYNLAPTKAEKTRVAQEVIDLVRGQDPPGRFLQKDTAYVGTGAGWWIEIDEERVMAKTSQALREGAPQIRAAHRQEPSKTKSGRKSVRKMAPSPFVKSSTNHSNSTAATVRPNQGGSALSKRLYSGMNSIQERALEQLHQNVMEAQNQSDSHGQQSHPPATNMSYYDTLYGDNNSNIVYDLDEEAEPASKRVRLEYNGQEVRPTDETPPLTSRKCDSCDDPSPFDLCAIPSPRKLESTHRSNSLALSGVSMPEDSLPEDWTTEDFVNPFEDESFLEANHEQDLDNGSRSSLRDSSSSVSFPSPKPGVFRETSLSSTNSLGGLSALFKDFENTSNHKKQDSGVRSTSRGSFSSTSSSRYDTMNESDASDPLLSIAPPSYINGSPTLVPLQ